MTVFKLIGRGSWKAVRACQRYRWKHGSISRSFLISRAGAGAASIGCGAVGGLEVSTEYARQQASFGGGDTHSRRYQAVRTGLLSQLQIQWENHPQEEAGTEYRLPHPPPFNGLRATVVRSTPCTFGGQFSHRGSLVGTPNCCCEGAISSAPAFVGAPPYRRLPTNHKKKTARMRSRAPRPKRTG